jgi:hypothetical protein
MQGASPPSAVNLASCQISTRSPPSGNCCWAAASLGHTPGVRAAHAGERLRASEAAHLVTALGLRESAAPGSGRSTVRVTADARDLLHDGAQPSRGIRGHPTRV